MHSGGGNAEDCSSGSLQSGGSPSGESNISGGSDRAGSWARAGAGSASSNSTTSSNTSATIETGHNSSTRVKVHSIEKSSLPKTDRPTSGSGGERPNPADIPNVVEYHLKVKTQSNISAVTRENRRICDNLPPDSESSAGMKEEEYRHSSSVPEDKSRKELAWALCRLSIDKNVFEGSQELPQIFQVKHLGSHDARGLWGIKHTRKPVDNMVTAAKALPTSAMLPLVKLIVSKEGVAFMPLEKKKQEFNSTKVHPIESISYGVQDLIYTRVFCMIVVRESNDFRKVSPFVCHAFVCESKQHARQLTYALATAFHLYSTTVKTTAQPKEHSMLRNPGLANSTPSAALASAASVATDTLKTVNRYSTIDLRSPEEIDTDFTHDSEA